MNLLITIDGPAASGKTTVGRLVAKELEWNFASTGLFYRGLSYIILQQDKTLLKKETIDSQTLIDLVKKIPWKVEFLDREAYFFIHSEKILDLYNEEISFYASKISQNSGLRKFLIPYQKKLFDPQKGLVVEGRDCGSLVFKEEACFKVYLDAQPEIRAQRRYQEKDEKDLKEVGENLDQRDKRDKERSYGSLKIPEGAFQIDTSSQSAEKTSQLILERFKKL